jgi:xanthine/CO dehydrogenase XdhC/CoxF family maturation factor
VIIEPIDENSASNPIDLLKTFLTNRARAALATIYHIEGEFQASVGQRMMWKAHQPIQNTIQDDELARLIENDLEKIQNSGQSVSKVYHTEKGRAEVFLEAMNPPLHLIVFGGGYDAVPVTKLAREIGWQVTVTDDCIAHLSPKRFPDADAIVPIDRHEVAQKLSIDAYTAALLISHNYKYDLAVLESLLDTNLRYIGILGPQKRTVKMFNGLNEKGKLKERDHQRIHGPVGLNIGAETPDEIALSIIAEIQAKFSGRPGNFLKDLEGPIHDEYPYFNA